eukprot:TRINITY_DN2919_c0_g1_i5.p1 TRINITY_DN2919_c0_g1~~TRINITY_DN2919_c0_g1_i5.p1  ORF type:complete len:161 (-),score=32.66 TRINITY_DN2919_c0_g1_i5:455-937(-)
MEVLSTVKFDGFAYCIKAYEHHAFATGNWQSIAQMDIETTQVIHHYGADVHNRYVLHLHKYHDVMASGDGRGLVGLWDTRAKSHIHTLLREDTVNHVHLDPFKLVVCDDRKKIAQYDRRKLGEPVCEVQRHDGFVICFVYDRQNLWSGDWDGQMLHHTLT